MTPTTTLTLDADPYPYTLHAGTTAFVVIDMQRDLVEPGGSPTAPAPVRHRPRRHRPADRRPVQRSGGDTT